MTEISTPLSTTTAPEALPRRVEVTRHGAVAALTLNRPEALNAFDDGMRKVFSDEIPRIARNPDVYVVVLKSTSPKAFCAGGDVRAIIALARHDMAAAQKLFADEYSLDWTLDCFSKPTVSLINGICMGSGAGLTLYNTHRVAGEAYKFAMPEVAIGLFPDVGVAHVLAKLQWPFGLYLGLTGRAIGRADAHWLGLATHCLSANQFQHVIDQFAACEPIDQVLDGLHEPQAPGPLQQERAQIEDAFSADSIRDILQRLEKSAGAGNAWAQSTLADMRKASPISLAITDRHIRAARAFDLRETLIEDYRLAIRCLNGQDFFEGVRAALVDKDGKPRWQHAKLEDVTNDEVASYFAPLGERDLKLLTRTEMQTMRV